MSKLTPKQISAIKLVRKIQKDQAESRELMGQLIHSLGISEYVPDEDRKKADDVRSLIENLQQFLSELSKSQSRGIEMGVTYGPLNIHRNLLLASARKVVSSMGRRKPTK